MPENINDIAAEAETSQFMKNLEELEHKYSDEGYWSKDARYYRTIMRHELADPDNLQQWAIDMFHKFLSMPPWAQFSYKQIKVIEMVSNGKYGIKKQSKF